MSASNELSGLMIRSGGTSKKQGLRRARSTRADSVQLRAGMRQLVELERRLLGANTGKLPLRIAIQRLIRRIGRP